LVADCSLAPSEFWAMQPGDIWWYLEAKIPRDPLKQKLRDNADFYIARLTPVDESDETP